jgi:hypothetical protein
MGGRTFLRIATADDLIRSPEKKAQTIEDYRVDGKVSVFEAGDAGKMLRVIASFNGWRAGDLLKGRSHYLLLDEGELSAFPPPVPDPEDTNPWPLDVRDSHFNVPLPSLEAAAAWVSLLDSKDFRQFDENRIYEELLRWTKIPDIPSELKDKIRERFRRLSRLSSKNPDKVRRFAPVIRAACDSLHILPDASRS